MTMNVGRQIAELRRMTVTQLRCKHIETFGEPTRSRHKGYLVKRIAWRLQANAEGNLTKRARQAGGRTGERRRPADHRPEAPDRRHRAGLHHQGRDASTHRPRPTPAAAWVVHHPHIQGPRDCGEGQAQGLRVRGRGVPLALGRRRGRHRQALERLPLLQAAAERRRR